VSEFEEQIIEEQIIDGDDPPEVDVQGEQGPVDWSRQLSSDVLLSPEVQSELERAKG
jgi:hypothetical protein